MTTAENIVIGNDHATWLAALDMYRLRLNKIGLRLNHPLPSALNISVLNDFNERIQSCMVALDKLEQRLHANIVDLGNETHQKALSEISPDVLHNHIMLKQDFALHDAFILEVLREAEQFMAAGTVSEGEL